MKALGYFKAHSLKDFSLSEVEVATPKIKKTDVLVRVKAISVNPVDYKIRQSRNGEETKPVILGWDASGIIEDIGENVDGFKKGDEVYYAGDLTRDGSNAELQAVDSRIVAKKPKTLNFVDAAAIPLTALTAFEALFEQGQLNEKGNLTVLVIGGAGGVGSMAIQLLKARTSAKVLATASRSETISWSKQMGADVIIDHSKPIESELKRNGISEVDLVFGTTQTAGYLKILPDIIKPFGHFVLIDDPKSLDIVDFKRKSISVSWELMFTKSLFNHDMESQGEILKEVAKLIDEGRIKTTAYTKLEGFSANNIRTAHELLGSGKSVGKIAISF